MAPGQTLRPRVPVVKRHKHEHLDTESHIFLDRVCFKNKKKYFISLVDILPNITKNTKKKTCLLLRQLKIMKL